MHPVQQIYHCFGCGAGGDVFKFVMEMDKCRVSGSDAHRGGKMRHRDSAAAGALAGRAAENQQRTALVEMHREAQTFFAQQIAGHAEGKVARAYLEDRGLTSRGHGALRDRLRAVRRRRAAAASESEISGEAAGGVGTCLAATRAGGCSIAFGGASFFRSRTNREKSWRSAAARWATTMPKYLNSPETPIYSKSNVLYHLDRAKEALRRVGFRDSRGRLHGCDRGGARGNQQRGGQLRHEPGGAADQASAAASRERVIVNYDPDTAGQAATERSHGAAARTGF